ncbi:MAG: hypothetical protein ACYSWT_12655 [Planctomycetota bacterium]
MLSILAGAMSPQSPLAPVLMVAGVVLFGALVTIGIRGKIARRNREAPSPREMIEQVKANRAQTDDAHAAASRLADTARRLSAQMDNKARRLEVLIREADERLAALSDLEGDRAPSVQTDGVRDAAAPPAAPPLDPLTRSVYEHADTGLTALEIAQQLDEQVGKVELILALREN